MSTRTEPAPATAIEVVFAGGKRVDAKVGEFVVRTDQSVARGGEGSAPEPLQLFLASIAACAGLYAQEFCRARRIGTEGMRLSLSATYDPEARRYARITIRLALPPGFPEGQREAIVRAVDACAVKKHIQSPPEFVTEVA